MHPVIREVIDLKLRDKNAKYIDILSELSEKYRDEFTIHDIADLVKKNRDLYRMLKQENF